MKALPFLTLCALACPAIHAAAEAQSQDTHQKIAADLIDLLSETEIALNSCRDEASVKAALPRFQELAAIADSIAARQAAIAPPTIQDDIAAAVYAEQFAMLWDAICRHINRLERAGLLSDELRDILRIPKSRTRPTAPAPTPAPAPAPAPAPVPVPATLPVPVPVPGS